MACKVLVEKRGVVHPQVLRQIGLELAPRRLRALRLLEPGIPWNADAAGFALFPELRTSGKAALSDVSQQSAPRPSTARSSAGFASCDGDAGAIDLT
jgi:hypothetical protein